MQKKSIENFIGVYDGYIPVSDCHRAIKLFNDQNAVQNTLNRLEFENSPATEKKDVQYFCEPQNYLNWKQELKPLVDSFIPAWVDYRNEVGALGAYGVKNFWKTTIKIQKTLPTEGYHLWHVEHGKGRENEARAFVFSIYLNDVEEGGETEFLHFSKRVKPVTGRIVIWPAGFPYVHRGNPPLSGEKYIATSWMNLTNEIHS